MLLFFVRYGIALLTFDGVQEIGVSILTSAGIAGIILGLSAQKVIGTILAGIQIAIAQPIRIDDVVIVEGEWGRVEEIKLTYVVVKIWDKRTTGTSLLPISLKNLSKTGPAILQTFWERFISIPTMIFLLISLRDELTRLLNATELWDGEVNVIQVTDANRKNHGAKGANERQ